ncbi:hypothetical protein GGI06_003861 [Coemansia sp. S85]|nr:hypothetical protein GGI06_003861 [Coemansia sp. S85]
MLGKNILVFKYDPDQEHPLRYHSVYPATKGTYYAEVQKLMKDKGDYSVFIFEYGTHISTLEVNVGQVDIGGNSVFVYMAPKHIDSFENVTGNYTQFATFIEEKVNEGNTGTPDDLELDEFIN